MKVCFFTIYLFISILLVNNSSFAQQNNTKYSNPIDGKLLLSANYGELRAGHFHGGLDLKVGGVPGANVYAVADGSVYRLNVSPWGYGNGFYLKHNDGNITVYGHLQRFAPKFATIVKKLQYRNQSFSVDTVFAEGAIQVKRGEIIGYAGNTGSSFGAHLHFELRTPDGVPINSSPLFYKIPDNVAPALRGLTIFTLDSIENTTLARIVNDLKLPDARANFKIDTTLIVENPVFFGVDCVDKVDETANKLGFRTMNVEMDGKCIFNIKIDSIAFDKGKYINSLQNYELLAKNARHVVQTRRQKNNKLAVYKQLAGDGTIFLNDDNLHSIKITLIDDYNNATNLNFKIKRGGANATKTKARGTNESFVSSNSGGLIFNDGIFLTFEPETLYEDAFINISKKDTVIANVFSDIYSIGNDKIAFHKQVDFSIRANVPDSLFSKVVLAKINSKGKTVMAADATAELNFVRSKISSYGTYFVTCDTEKPKITLKFKNGADLRKQKSLKIIITDNLSGINNYEGYIDGKWALFEYDAKNNLLTYIFDTQMLVRGKKHKLVLRVSDLKSNESEVDADFLW